MLVVIGSVLSTTWLVYRARAAADERLGAVGTELLRYARSRYVGERQHVRVNGMSFVLHVGSTDDGVREVLAHFTRRCRTGQAAWDTATFHAASDTQGYLACVDTDGVRPDAAWLRTRLTEFARELDVAAFGALLYVTAARSHGATTYLVVQSAGPLPLTGAFPPDRDAPGFDPSWVPRPKDSLRVLSAAADSGGASLHVFRAPSAGPQQALNDYANTLSAAGFELQRDADLRLRGRTGEGDILIAARSLPDATTYVALVASPRATAAAAGR